MKIFSKQTQWNKIVRVIKYSRKRFVWLIDLVLEHLMDNGWPWKRALQSVCFDMKCIKKISFYLCGIHLGRTTKLLWHARCLLTGKQKYTADFFYSVHLISTNILIRLFIMNKNPSQFLCYLKKNMFSLEWSFQIKINWTKQLACILLIAIEPEIV